METAFTARQKTKRMQVAAYLNWYSFRLRRAGPGVLERSHIASDVEWRCELLTMAIGAFFADKSRRAQMMFLRSPDGNDGHRRMTKLSST
jgi:hypothetical protein